MCYDCQASTTWACHSVQLSWQVPTGNMQALSALSFFEFVSPCSSPWLQVFLKLSSLTQSKTTYYYRLEVVKIMKAPQISKYVKHYCCLYHFTNGKAEKASTPCYNHVPLGIINPPQSTHPRSPKPSASSLRLLSKPQSINNHTHDVNEIERKMSLPKRLAYPRLYVEQIIKKNSVEAVNPIATYQAFLKKKQFQEIFVLFKKIAKTTGFKSELDVIKSYTKFATLNKISEVPDSSASHPQVCFSKAQFTNYLVELGISEQEATEFWDVAFTQGRFSPNSQGIGSKTGVVSMKAFAYNFRKFYLEEVYSFKSCLSEAALRQRLIDLRLFLQPWFQRNIIFKYNHQFWKEQELQCCAQLKRYNETTIYAKILSMIQLRNKIWLFMRTLSKIIYQVTDQKNVGLAVFNDRATAFIQKQTNNLAVWAELVNQFENYIISTGKPRQGPFKITDLLQFSKAKLPDHMEQILCYLRGIFKYLYFFKKSPLLSLNQETLNIDCNGIAQVTFSLLLEFFDYKRRESNHLMEMVESVCSEVNEIVEARPEVNGHKSFLNECNYLAEALLKMIKRCDFSVFNRLASIRQLYLNGNISDTVQIKSILEQMRGEEDGSEVKESLWKNMFSFHKQAIVLDNNQSLTSSDHLLDKNYQAALEAYEELRKKLEGKLPSQPQDYSKRQVVLTAQKTSQAEKQHIKEKMKVHDEQRQTQDLMIQEKHSCFDSAYCSLCDDICSTSLNSSLNRIDSMSDYILNMLRDI